MPNLRKKVKTNLEEKKKKKEKRKRKHINEKQNKVGYSKSDSIINGEDGKSKRKNKYPIALN